MDAALIILMALFFCVRSMNAPDSIELTLEEQASIQIETKLNDSFYQDEHAFEVISNGLNFHS